MSTWSLILLAIAAVMGLFLYFTTMFDQTRSFDYSGKVEPSNVLVTKIYTENKNINSLLSSLMTTKFFRIFKVNLLRECEFFSSSQKCRLDQCPVYEEEGINVTDVKTFIVNKTLDPKSQEFTTHIPLDAYTDNAEGWTEDEALDKDGIYVDLKKNPERYTGFNGSDIWNEIYWKNLPKLKFKTPGPHQDLLYRIISGVHTNINMHISHFYMEDVEKRENFTLIDFHPDYEIFYERIGKYPDRIKNLFYTYVFMIDALTRVKANLPHYTYYTYDAPKNLGIQNRMKWFGHYVSGILDPKKIQSDLFKSITPEELVEQIKPTFKNITELFNWIQCDICKLNSRVQFIGTAAMFKILFTEKGKEIVLSENELVGFINTVYRLSNSIKWYEEFLEYEAKEAFFKTMMYWIVLSIAAIFLILSVIVYCLSGPPKQQEDRVPLRIADAGFS